MISPAAVSALTPRTDAKMLQLFKDGNAYTGSNVAQKLAELARTLERELAETLAAISTAVDERDELRRQLAEAVAKERERAAKIVEDGEGTTQSRMACAAAIRQGQGGEHG